MASSCREARCHSACSGASTSLASQPDGVDNSGKNRVVRAFAAARPGTQVPDWAGAVATDPGILQPDGLHPNPQGAELRARLIAQGVEGCLAFVRARTEAQEPILESAPEQLEAVAELRRRQAELLRAAVTAVAGAGAAALLGTA